MLILRHTLPNEPNTRRHDNHQLLIPIPPNPNHLSQDVNNLEQQILLHSKQELIMFNNLIESLDK